MNPFFLERRHRSFTPEHPPGFHQEWARLREIDTYGAIWRGIVCRRIDAVTRLLGSLVDRLDALRSWVARPREGRETWTSNPRPAPRPPEAQAPYKAFQAFMERDA